MNRLILVLVAVLIPTTQQQGCTNTDDFSIAFNGLTAFVVSKSNLSCSCDSFSSNALRVAQSSTLGNTSFDNIYVSGSAKFAGAIAATAGPLSISSPVSVVDVATSTFGGPFAVGGAMNVGVSLTSGGSLSASGQIRSGSTTSQGGFLATGPVPAGGMGSQSIWSVQRDFMQWSSTGSSCAQVHIKTNIKNALVMYRFVIEGYNYANSADIWSTVVGYLTSGTMAPGSFYIGANSVSASPWFAFSFVASAS
eukprot:TRINITY_DN31184_c0_g1_i1.p1 TRINITY_DN31184_c0_g1~~TRINITY_DN31184_c0_g1_i1.p1  ORF type:complete len:251 (-),score=27.58 TRINITY_DN31184_c0_g1_i1:148-900(-)